MKFFDIPKLDFPSQQPKVKIDHSTFTSLEIVGMVFGVVAAFVIFAALVWATAPAEASYCDLALAGEIQVVEEYPGQTKAECL